VQDDVPQHRDPDPVPGHPIRKTGPRGPGLSRASCRCPGLAGFRLRRHAAPLQSRKFPTAAPKTGPRPWINCRPGGPGLASPRGPDIRGGRPAALPDGGGRHPVDPVRLGNLVSCRELGFCCRIRGVPGTLSGCCC
jgi:hypothetical protein